MQPGHLRRRWSAAARVTRAFAAPAAARPLGPTARMPAAVAVPAGPGTGASASEASRATTVGAPPPLRASPAAAGTASASAASASATRALAAAKAASAAAVMSRLRQVAPVQRPGSWCWPPGTRVKPGWWSSRWARARLELAAVCLCRQAPRRARAKPRRRSRRGRAVRPTHLITSPRRRRLKGGSVVAATPRSGDPAVEHVAVSEAAAPSLAAVRRSERAPLAASFSFRRTASPLPARTTGLAVRWTRLPVRRIVGSVLGPSTASS